MSIIEDALKRAQEQREMAGGETSAPPEAERGQSRKRKRARSNRRPVVYGALIALILLIGGAIWFFINTLESENKRSVQKQNLLSGQMGMEAPKAIRLDIDEPVDLKNDTRKADKTPATDFSRDEKAAAPAVAVSQVSEQNNVTIDPQKNISSEKSFIGSGWSKLDGGDIGSALDVWRKGLLLAPKEDVVLVASAYMLQEAAIKKLKELGQENHAFVVPGVYHGKDGYYLLSYPPAEDIYDYRKVIANRLNIKTTVRGNFVETLTGKLGIGAGRSDNTTRVSKSEKPAKDETVSTRPKKSLASDDRRARFIESLKGALPETVEQAKRKISEGKYSDAANLLRPLLDENQDKWEPYYLMGSALLGQGDIKGAEEFTRRGIAADSSQSRLWVQLSMVEQHHGDHARALQYLTNARRLNAKSPDVWLNIGYSNDSLGEYNAAAAAYTEFIRLSEGKKAYLGLREQVLARLSELR